MPVGRSGRVLAACGVSVPAVVLLACGLAFAPVARAQDDQRARLHFESGASYYEAGEYEDALREFQRAYELSQRAQLFYNMSLCYQNLGDFAQAASYLERYLNEVPNIENRANLEIRLRNLRERVAHQEGARAGEAAAPVAAAGAQGASGERGQPERGEQAAGGLAEAGPSDGASVEPRRAGGGDGVNGGAIAGFSVAAAGLVLGGIFGALTVAEDGRIAGTPCGGARTCGDSDLGDLRTFAALADVGFGVALLGAAVGVVFLAVGGSSSDGDDRRASFEVVPRAARDGAGLVLEGSF